MAVPLQLNSLQSDLFAAELSTSALKPGHYTVDPDDPLTRI